MRINPSETRQIPIRMRLIQLTDKTNCARLLAKPQPRRKDKLQCDLQFESAHLHIKQMDIKQLDNLVNISSGTDASVNGVRRFVVKMALNV